MEKNKVVTDKKQFKVGQIIQIERVYGRSSDAPLQLSSDIYMILKVGRTNIRIYQIKTGKADKCPIDYILHTDWFTVTVLSDVDEAGKA